MTQIISTKRSFVHSAVEGGIALGVSSLLQKFLPLPVDDPLRSTLIALPLIVAALYWLGIYAPRRRKASGDEIFALALLFLLTTARHSFGLAATDWFLVGGWMLLLSLATARRVLAWRPALGKSLPSRPSAAFFWLPFVFYLALQPWLMENRPPDGDEPYYLLVAHSISQDFDADLTNNYAEEHSLSFMGRAIEPQPGDPRDASGAIYSRHNILLPLVLSPLYGLGGKHVVLIGMAAMAALLGWMLLRLAHYEDWWPKNLPPQQRPGAALLAWAICVFSPPLLLYSYQVWTEVPAALLICLALDRILLLDGRPPQRYRDRAALFLSILFLPILKLRFGIVALPLALLAWHRGGGSFDPRRILRMRGPALAMIGVLGLGFGGMLLHNYIRYGNALKVYGWHQILILTSPENYLLGGLGLFWDFAFGLFFCAPIWFLILPALALRPPGWKMLLLLSAPYLIVAVPRTEWFGGWSPPFRYALVFLPFLALLMMPLLAERRRVGMRFVALPLALATLFAALLWTAIPGWTYNFADGRSLLLDRASVVLDLDLARLFPSMVRTRAATWIWPLASLLLIPLALYRRSLSLGPLSPGPLSPGSLRAKIQPTLLGTATLLLVLAGIPWLAKDLPTRIVEWEDPWTRHQGGQVHPDIWTRQRPLHTGGWLVAPQTRLRATIESAGERVTLRFYGQTVRSEEAVPLRVLAGKEQIGTILLDPIGWHEQEIGPVEWPEGAELIVEGAWPQGAARVIVDRTELEWD